MKNYLYSIVIDNNSKKGKAFDIFIQLLILVSIIAFSIETIPTLNESQKCILNYIEKITLYIFTIEYVLRTILTKPFRNYTFSFFGIIDFLAVFPMYITTGGIDLRTIRILRLFKLFRTFKLLKYSNALIRLGNAFKEVRNDLIVFFTGTLLLIYISSVGIYFFENTVQPENFKSVFDAMWWSLITITTVGYGDIVPITTGGKVFTGLITLIGIALIAVPTGLLSSAFISQKK